MGGVVGDRIRKFDDTDMKILAELVEDASLSVPKLSKKIKANPSVVYSRIKRMVRRELIKKFTVEVNEELLGYAVSALVGVNIDPRLRESILEELPALDEVREVMEVTGRFDIVADIRAKSLNELHIFIFSKLAKLQGVRDTETLVVLNRKKKETSMEKKEVSGKGRQPHRVRRARRSKASSV